jgi:hypothetical protein
LIERLKVYLESGTHPVALSAKDLSQYPELVEFEGIGNVSLLQIHLIAASVIILGVIFAILAPPGGYVALLVFIAIGAVYDIIFIRKSQTPVRVKLFLRTNPVKAALGENNIGEIKSGTLILDMENENELGYRAASNRRPSIWIFDSPEDAKIVAKRLMEYLPIEK